MLVESYASLDILRSFLITRIAINFENKHESLAMNKKNKKALANLQRYKLPCSLYSDTLPPNNGFSDGGTVIESLFQKTKLRQGGASRSLDFLHTFLSKKKV